MVTKRFYFAANDGTNGSELWVSDGTDAGTKMLKDINPGAGSSGPENFTVYNGKLYFAGSNGTGSGKNGYELWVTDGTAAGTKMLKDINSGVGNSSPAYFKEYNGKLYFSAKTPGSGYELWVTDGTDAGTKMVKDINVGVADSDPRGFTEYNGKLYFSASNGTGSGENGRELWVSDGTAAGTQIFKDINGTAGSSPSGFTVY